MGSAVKNVKQSFSKLLAVIGAIFVILAFVYWNQEIAISGASLGFSIRAGEIVLTHWESLALGFGLIFLAYAFDAESASEVVGYTGDMVKDATESVVEVASTAAKGITDIAWDNLAPIGMAVGGVYLAGKVIENDNSESGGNFTLDFADSGFGKEFTSQGRDVRGSGAGRTVPKRGIQSDDPKGSGDKPRISVQGAPSSES